MDAKPRQRRLLQFHLVTAVVMMLVAGALLPLVIPYLRAPVDYQKVAEGAEWDLKGTVKDNATSIAANRSKYGVGASNFGMGNLALLVWTNPDRAHVATIDLQSWDRSAFIIQDELLFAAIYSPMSSGCILIAHDLRTNRRLWGRDSMGLGPIDHSKYRNQVHLRMQDNVLVVYGDESAGKYVEYVDAKTGETVGHKIFGGKMPYGVKVPPRPFETGAFAARLGLILLAALVAGGVCEWVVRWRTARRA